MLALALTWLAPFAPRSPAQQIPHEKLAREVLAQAELDETATFSMEPLLERSYLRCDLGLFELYVPRAALAQEGSAKRFQTVSLALVDLQMEWLGWLEAGRERGSVLRKEEVEPLRGWVASWRTSKLQDLAGNEESSLEAWLGADEKVRAVAQRLSAEMRSGKVVGLAREVASSEAVVIAPTRADFVALLSVAGWIYPRDRAVFWQPAVASWAYSFIDRYKVLALELAGPGVAQGDWRSGVDMNARRPTGLAQQAAQLCANSMLDNLCGDHIPPSLAGALAVNLVVANYGECNTRVDGDSRERRTNAREVFVPGGASEGGVLPPTLADSRWRAGGGADHFVGVLREAQVEGAAYTKDKKDKQGWFLLEDDGGSSQQPVRAPFMGAAAGASEPVAVDFKWDHLEFLRSYRSCFLHWLQNASESTPKRSQEQFARLLLQLAQGDAESVEAVFPKILGGLTLSSVTPGKKDLEGRFLTWLAKQGGRK